MPFLCGNFDNVWWIDDGNRLHVFCPTGRTRLYGKGEVAGHGSRPTWLVRVFAHLRPEVPARKGTRVNKL